MSERRERNHREPSPKYDSRSDRRSSDDFLSLTFRELPPEFISDEILHERLDACKFLASLLLNNSGSKVTPICDNMFGSGKTSLIFKFRSVLNRVSWPERPTTYHLLQNAIYLNIQFKVGAPHNLSAPV